MEPILPIPGYCVSVWGGSRLTDIRGITPPEGQQYGICREVSAYRNTTSKILSGEYAGKTLHELIGLRHGELLGRDPADQLVRVAYIDAREDLSIQVHPGEEYASRVENDFEKSESWYILDCDEGAYVVAGTTVTDKEQLREAAADGTIEQYIRKVPVKKGDFVMIPAGMLHACGKNMLALEAGSFGGITYRLYDYGRGRELHLEKGFDVLDPALQPEVRHFEPGSRPAAGASVREAIRHPSFCVDIVDIADEWEPENNGICLSLTAVEGNAVVETAEGRYQMNHTHTVLLPSDRKSCKVKGNCRILCCWHPF